MLAVKVRPKTLDGVFGNVSAIKALENLLKVDEKPHVYLFQGESGCGKTTLARIMANEFGCFGIGLVEMNGANDRGIDSARSIEEQSRFRPLSGENRGLILDECHMLTREAQGALLKVLEDVPEYQYYFLCTTDPQKMLKAIRTRCDVVEVKPLNDDDMWELLCSVVKDNDCKVSDDVLNKILVAAEGCPRVAITLLEHVAGLDEDQADGAVKSYTGDNAETFALCKALIDQKISWSGFVKIYKGISLEPEKIRYMILGYLKTCLLNGGQKRFADMIEIMSENTYDGKEAKLISLLYYCKKM